MVFFSTCACVEYFGVALGRLLKGPSINDVRKIFGFLPLPPPFLHFTQAISTRIHKICHFFKGTIHKGRPLDFRDFGPAPSPLSVPNSRNLSSFWSEIG